MRSFSRNFLPPEKHGKRKNVRQKRRGDYMEAVPSGAVCCKQNKAALNCAALFCLWKKVVYLFAIVMPSMSGA